MTSLLLAISQICTDMGWRIRCRAATIFTRKAACSVKNDVTCPPRTHAVSTPYSSTHDAGGNSHRGAASDERLHRSCQLFRNKCSEALSMYASPSACTSTVAHGHAGGGSRLPGAEPVVSSAVAACRPVNKEPRLTSPRVTSVVHSPNICHG